MNALRIEQARERLWQREGVILNHMNAILVPMDYSEEEWESENARYRRHIHARDRLTQRLEDMKA